ncbi:MAG: GIY-YIG nuclease family protein [Maricaulaceae bacterium]|nr:GIY-YIG nuclease family protein [Maricaulaceae bacterium]
MFAFVYILRCADGSYYVGSHRGDDVMTRVVQHQAGEGGDYTRRRLPVTLVYSDWFDRAEDAVAAERRLKGWSRAKKEALVRGDGAALKALSRGRTGKPKPP